MFTLMNAYNSFGSLVVKHKSFFCSQCTWDEKRKYKRRWDVFHKSKHLSCIFVVHFEVLDLDLKTQNNLRGHRLQFIKPHGRQLWLSFGKTLWLSNIDFIISIPWLLKHASPPWFLKYVSPPCLLKHLLLLIDLLFYELFKRLNKQVYKHNP